MRALLLFIAVALALTDQERYNQIKSTIDSIVSSPSYTTDMERETMIHLLRSSVSDLAALEKQFGPIQGAKKKK